MRKALIWSICLYLAACASPALIFHVQADLGQGRSVWTGYRTDSGLSLLGVGLLWGWMRLNFTAFANPLLWLSWIMAARQNFAAARALSLAALMLSVETLQLLVQPMLWDEGATRKGYLAAPHIGFVLWIASMLIIFWSSRRTSRIIGG
jgi:hypothetical protein